MLSARLPLVLDKVWVMDSSALDLPGPPVERAMTVGAPHLTAPISLVDDVPTLRTAL